VNLSGRITQDIATGRRARLQFGPETAKPLQALWRNERKRAQHGSRSLRPLRSRYRRAGPDDNAEAGEILRPTDRSGARPVLDWHRLSVPPLHGGIRDGLL